MEFRTLSNEDLKAIQDAIKAEINRRRRRLSLEHQLQTLIQEIEEEGYTICYGDIYITKDGVELVGD